MAHLARPDHFGERPAESVQDMSRELLGIGELDPAVPKRQKAIVKPDGTVLLAGYTITRMGVVRNQPLNGEDWQQLGVYLLANDDGQAWRWGDYLVEGDHVWGVTYQAVAEALGKDTQTIENWAWVARTFDFSCRQEKLSWTHHFEVAGLTVEKRDELLAWALENNKSASALRAKVAGKPQRDPVDPVAVFQDRLAGLRSLIKPKVAPGQRMQCAALLRQMADEIEKGE